eukprot:TRINITY_DN15305_c0_g1_i1.p1 TRINITY_DN15305_c0_g1~~TRINITY_DN15305_c0_g1_i1.p1  ORF type:complete len:325 (+),score=99.21 TRINITY_DN15305_c0_g1_i1:176-1150(+)
MADLADAAAAVAGFLFDGIERKEMIAVRAACSALAVAVRGPLTAMLSQAAVAANGNGPSAQHRRACALRGLACVAASGGGDKRATGLVAGYLQDKGAAVRRTAASALAGAAGDLAGTSDFDASRAVELLGPALADCDEQVSTAAAKAIPRLVNRGDGKATAVALGHVQSLSPWVRRSAIAVLTGVAARGNADAVKALTTVLQNDSDWRARAAAARALPSIAERGHEEATSALKAALKDGEKQVRQVAAGAIAHVAALPSMPFLAIKAEKYREPLHRKNKRQVSPTPPAPSARRRRISHPTPSKASKPTTVSGMSRSSAKVKGHR